MACWLVSARVLAEPTLWSGKRRTQDACGLRAAAGRGSACWAQGSHPHRRLRGAGHTQTPAKVSKQRPGGRGPSSLASSLSAQLEPSTEHSRAAGPQAQRFICVWPPPAAHPAPPRREEPSASYSRRLHCARLAWGPARLPLGRHPNSCFPSALGPPHAPSEPQSLHL